MHKYPKSSSTKFSTSLRINKYYINMEIIIKNIYQDTKIEKQHKIAQKTLIVLLSN